MTNVYFVNMEDKQSALYCEFESVYASLDIKSLNYRGNTLKFNLFFTPDNPGTHPSIRQVKTYFSITSFSKSLKDYVTKAIMSLDMSIEELIKEKYIFQFKFKRLRCKLGTPTTSAYSALEDYVHLEDEDAEEVKDLPVINVDYIVSNSTQWTLEDNYIYMTKLTSNVESSEGEVKIATTHKTPTKNDFVFHNGKGSNRSGSTSTPRLPNGDDNKEEFGF